MKNLVLILSALVLGTASTLATSTENKVAERNAYRYNNSFIFVENGITFSVYPDGEFDFYIDDRVVGRRNGITFNSGFDYNPYVQYDDYGAVIQVENIPIYYDYYGRVTQIGNVDLSYNSGRVRRIGGMQVYYNTRGIYDYHTGYINMYNRHYVFRPFHRLFIRPAIGFSLVFNRPYRRYYRPIRYTYYRPYLHNHRRAYAKIGKTHRYNQVRRERSQVYRNDKRVALRENATRSNRNVAQRYSGVSRSNGAINKGDNRSLNRQGNTVRSNGTNRNATTRTTVSRSNTSKGNTYQRGNTKSANRVVKRSTTVRNPKQNTVTKRTVRQMPRSKTVTRSTKTYKAPQKTNKVATRSTSTSRRKITQAPTRSRSSVSTRSSSARRNVAKAPARSSTNRARTSSTRSSRSY